MLTHLGVLQNEKHTTRRYLSFKEFINILVEKKCNILDIRDEQLVRRFVTYIASDIKERIEKENYF